MLNRDVFYKDPKDYRIINQGVADISFPPSPDALNTLKGELSTFVCDGEYGKGLVQILEGFLRDADRGDVPCAWISGFYGSGKSHLAKMLAALWNDLEFPDKSRASALIQEMPGDLIAALKELRVLARRVGATHVAGDTLGAGADDSIKATLGIILRSAGLPTDIRAARVAFWLADEDILTVVRDALGSKFDDEIRNFVLSTRFAEAVLAAKPSLASSTKELRDYFRANFPQPPEVTVDDLVQITRRALTLENGIMPLTLIVLDEVQQFVRADPSRTLVIQAIAQRFAKEFSGRILLVCTGQQALADVPYLQRLLGRFSIRISLKEADIDAVIRKTVLRKKPDAVPAIVAMLESVSGEVSRQLSGSRDAHGPTDKADAPADWPLLPTRRRVWERILRSLDHSGLGGTLRTQLSVVLDAARAVAGEPLGHAVPADYLYDRFADDALNAGLLPRETRQMIEKLRAGGDDDRLKARILMLVYMLGEIRGDVDQHGVRARTDIISDLLVEDLSSSSDIRRRTPDLLTALRDDGAVLEISGEWRIQTKEGAEWETAFRTEEKVRQADLPAIDRVRRETLSIALNGALGGLVDVKQGRSAVSRKINRLYGMDEKAPTDGVPLRIHTGYDSDLKDIEKQIAAAAIDDPTVHILIPRHRPDEMVADLARWLAADDVVKLKGVPEGDGGKQARAAMETRSAHAKRNIDAIAQEAIDKAEVRQAGGSIISGSMAKAVKDAAINSLARIYPKFGDADHPRWDAVVSQAQRGQPDAIAAVDYTGEPQTHPVCKAILATLGAGKKGSDIRNVFEAPPYGWPKDAVDSAILVLDNAGIILTQDEAHKLVALRSLPRQKIGLCSFRPEKVTVSVAERLAVGGLMKEAGVDYTKEREAEAIPLLLHALAQMAASAGGEAPAPIPATLPDYKSLTILTGNEQLKEVASRAGALKTALTGWRNAKTEIDQRLPTWRRAERLVALGATDQIAALSAILTGRRLLENPDPLPSLVQDAAEALRIQLNTAWATYEAAWTAGEARLSRDITWGKLTPEQRHDIRAGVGLLKADAPMVGSPQEIIDALSARSLSGWGDLSKSLPTRIDDALADAAALLEPKAKPLVLPGLIIKSEAELDEWLETLREKVLAALVNGPVIPRI